jgi:carbonic anhydrase
VGATVRALETGMGHSSANIRSITDRIAPHIQDIVRSALPDRVSREAVRANVRASVDHLRHGSRILEELVLAGRLAIVGAEYEIETGHVRFLDSVLAGDAVDAAAP